LSSSTGLVEGFTTHRLPFTILPFGESTTHFLSNLPQKIQPATFQTPKSPERDSKHYESMQLACMVLADNQPDYGRTVELI
jgi:hypothetical protein